MKRTGDDDGKRHTLKSSADGKRHTLKPNNLTIFL